MNPRHIRLFLAFIAAAVLPSGLMGQPATSPATLPAPVTLRIHSVRIGRSADLQKSFPTRYSSDVTPGVSMQLLMTFADTQIIAPDMDAISVETFIDDTYQSLISGNRGSGYQQSYLPAVSEDGKQLLFGIQSSRPPADTATRVFVRGTLSARAARGELKTDRAPLPLKVGQQVKIGPFTTTIRSISEGGPRNMSVNFTVEGDARRIRDARLLADGRRLNDAAQLRMNHLQSGQSSTFSANIPSGNEQLVLEYHFVDALEPVRIPFEAQVDLGANKAGPIQPDNGKAEVQAPASDRPWPPPPVASSTQLPPSRTPFSPTTMPTTEARKLERAAVDIFSLTVGKPAPEEAAGVKWANPPSPSLRASGFTLARLMLSTPGARILTVPAEAVSISRFEDDKGTRHVTTQYRDTSGFRRASNIGTSPDGQQALISVSLASAPTTGATRCTIAGTIRATVARDEKVEASEPVALTRGQSLKTGPFTIQFRQVRQIPALTPLQSVRGIEVSLELTGPVERLLGVELLDSATQQLLAARLLNREEQPQADIRESVSFPLQVSIDTPDRVIVRLRHCSIIEPVEIPFVIDTALGL